MLSELGLALALRSECNNYAQRTGIQASFSSEGIPEDLPDDISICLYRLTQEALQNAWKHAETSRVDVTVSATPDVIVLKVEDFGKGFDPDTKAGGGLGLVSMQERARLVGGGVSIKSKPGAGTLIEVRIPLERNPHGTPPSTARG